MIQKTSSIVLVDKRPHRKIAQENWGLTDEQMVGKHVHHRISISRGGTNDPTNLYVCSPWFHQHMWHKSEEWIGWANLGGTMGAEACRKKRESDPEWAQREKERLRLAAKLSHSKALGTEEYSNRQRLKSLKTHTIKRKGWTEETYDTVWKFFLQGLTTGYKVGRAVDDKKWKKYSNMLKYASLGFSFSQLMDQEEYLNERERLKQSPIAHILDCYND